MSHSNRVSQCSIKVQADITVGINTVILGRQLTMSCEQTQTHNFTRLVRLSCDLENN